MKRCPKCGETKPFEEFHRNPNWKDGYQVYCKPCRRRYDRDYYQRTGQRWNEKRRERNRAFRKARIEWLRALKMRPCADCGGSFAPEAMEWDHLPGAEKLGTISKTIRGRTTQAILDEIAKCDLVCAVCHAIRTRRRLLEQTAGHGVKEASAIYSGRRGVGFPAAVGVAGVEPTNLPLPKRTLYLAELHPG